MPYKHQWLDLENGIMLWEMHGKVTWTEFHESVNAIANDIDSVPHHSYLVIQDTTGMPDGNAIPHFKTAVTKWSNRKHLDGLVVVADRNIALLVKSLTDIVNSTVAQGVTLDHAPDMDKALEIVAKRRKLRQQ